MMDSTDSLSIDESLLGNSNNLPDDVRDKVFSADVSLPFDGTILNTPVSSRHNSLKTTPTVEEELEKEKKKLLRHCQNNRRNSAPMPIRYGSGHRLSITGSISHDSSTRDMTKVQVQPRGSVSDVHGRRASAIGASDVADSLSTQLTLMCNNYGRTMMLLNVKLRSLMSLVKQHPARANTSEASQLWIGCLEHLQATHVEICRQLNILEKSNEIPTYDNANLIVMVEVDNDTQALQAEIQSLLHPTGKIQSAFGTYSKLFKAVKKSEIALELLGLSPECVSQIEDECGTAYSWLTGLVDYMQNKHSPEYVFDQVIAAHRWKNIFDVDMSERSSRW